MTNDSRLKIGSRLKDVREYLGLSKEEVAVVANISRSAVSLIESGQRKLDSVELIALAKLYQHPMAYFTSDDFSVELDPEAAVFARVFSGLSDDDKKELAQFSKFLAARSKNKE